MAGTRPADPSGTMISIPDDDSTADGKQVFLTAGAENEIDITVTAENGDTKTYTVTVYRKNSSPSNENKLSALDLSDVTLSPSFAADKTTYTANAVYSADRNHSVSDCHARWRDGGIPSSCFHRRY